MIPSFLILTEVFRLAEEFDLQYFCFVELLEATFVLLFVDQFFVDGRTNWERYIIELHFDFLITPVFFIQ